MLSNSGLMPPFMSKRTWGAKVEKWCHMTEDPPTIHLPASISIPRYLHSHRLLGMMNYCPKYFGTATFLNPKATVSGRTSYIKIPRAVSCWRRIVGDTAPVEQDISTSVTSSELIELLKDIFMWSTDLQEIWFLASLPLTYRVHYFVSFSMLLSISRTDSYVRASGIKGTCCGNSNSTCNQTWLHMITCQKVVETLNVTCPSIRAITSTWYQVRETWMVHVLTHRRVWAH